MSELKDIVEYYRNKKQNNIHDQYDENLKNDLSEARAVNAKQKAEIEILQERSDTYEQKYLGAQQKINNLTTHIAGMVTVGIIKPDFARELLGSCAGLVDVTNLKNHLNTIDAILAGITNK